MSETLIDVIIPVYNDMKYLKPTVDSVLAQTISDFVITLVDDCSTDGSADLCDSLALLDNRIRVIHNEKNLNVSGSREAGLKATEAPWVFFMDHDDVIKPDTFERLLALSDKAEVLCIRGEERAEEETDNPDWMGDGDGKITVVSGQKACLSIVSHNHDWGYVGSLWGKLWDRKLLVKCLEITGKYRESCKCSYFEDALCMPILFRMADHVAVDNTFCYIHRRITDSLSISLRPSGYMYDLAFANELLVEYMASIEAYELRRHLLLGLFMTAQSVWYRSANYEENRDKWFSYDSYVTSLIDTYYGEFSRTAPKGFGEKLKYKNIKSCVKNLKNWNSTIGHFWFEGIYKMPLLANKLR